MQPIPNSPPPSFRSRASSPTRRDAVDPDLADAFDDDASDEEADDRQRLVRRNAPPSDSSSISLRVDDGTSLAQSAPTTQSNVASSAIRGRVVGGGGGSDGVFANLSAKPERTDSEKDEMPPVSRSTLCLRWNRLLMIACSHMSKRPPMPHLRTGKPPFLRLAWVDLTRSTLRECPLDQCFPSCGMA